MPAPPRVLVVEDDARLAATLERVLVAEGHEVEVAGDGLDALRRAKLRPPDLAVLDVMLPGADGITVCRRLRETPVPNPHAHRPERNRGTCARPGQRR